MKHFFLILIIINLGACSSVPKLTFTGATIPEGAESFSVVNFANDAADGPADLGIRFTEELRDYFQRNTPLNPVVGAGDLQFSGVISRYELRPVSAGASNTQGAQLQRLTIAVSYDYIVVPNDELSIEKGSASQFADFPASQNLADVEDGLIDEIFEQIIFDIFNRTLADW
jgi:hypothetical protein